VRIKDRLFDFFGRYIVPSYVIAIGLIPIKKRLILGHTQSVPVRNSRGKAENTSRHAST